MMVGIARSWPVAGDTHSSVRSTAPVSGSSQNCPREGTFRPIRGADDRGRSRSSKLTRNTARRERRADRRSLKRNRDWRSGRRNSSGSVGTLIVRIDIAEIELAP